VTESDRSWGPIAPEQWEQGVGEFEVSQQDRAFVLSGPCPGCGHTITKDLSLMYGAGLSPSTLSGMRLKVTCNCGELHGGSPDREVLPGCGAWGGVELSIDD